MRTDPPLNREELVIPLKSDLRELMDKMLDEVESRAGRDEFMTSILFPPSVPPLPPVAGDNAPGAIEETDVADGVGVALETLCRGMSKMSKREAGAVGFESF